jgi:hypothetical protein
MHVVLKTATVPKFQDRGPSHCARWPWAAHGRKLLGSLSTKLHAGPGDVLHSPPWPLVRRSWPCNTSLVPGAVPRSPVCRIVVHGIGQHLWLASYTCCCLSPCTCMSARSSIKTSSTTCDRHRSRMTCHHVSSLRQCVTDRVIPVTAPCHFFAPNNSMAGLSSLLGISNTVHSSTRSTWIDRTYVVLVRATVTRAASCTTCAAARGVPSTAASPAAGGRAVP